MARAIGVRLAPPGSVAGKLDELQREAEEATAKIRALTDRTARHTADVEALIAEHARVLHRAAAILAAERARTASGLRPKFVPPSAAVDRERDEPANDD